jgi:hypothetical protein
MGFLIMLFLYLLLLKTHDFVFYLSVRGNVTQSNSFSGKYVFGYMIYVDMVHEM